MSIFFNFFNRRTMNALNAAKESREYVALMIKDMKEDPSVKVNNWSERFIDMASKLNDEQKQRLSVFTNWTRIAWVLIACMFFMSVISLSLYSIIYYGLFMVCLYVFIGYRFWVFNTKIYPPFRVYLKMLHKYPLAGIPYNNNHLKDL